VNRAQRRAQEKKKRISTPREQKNAQRIINQLFIWRYMEDHWWRMTTGWGFRGIVEDHKKAHAHNLALELPLHWHAISITYLMDPWGKRYKVFGFARSNQTLRGFREGICPLLEEALTEAEDNINSRQIYGRGMVFAPWSRSFDTLLPILRLKREQLRLDDNDLEELARAEAEWAETPAEVKQVFLPDMTDIDDQIAALMQETP